MSFKYVLDIRDFVMRLGRGMTLELEQLEYADKLEPPRRRPGAAAEP